MRACHGVRQLFEPAMRPSCDVRHSRAADGACEINSVSWCASAVSGVVAGFGMNALSLLELPSPLMSPETSGVSGSPDWKNDETPTFSHHTRAEALNRKLWSGTDDGTHSFANGSPVMPTREPPRDSVAPRASV